MLDVIPQKYILIYTVDSPIRFFGVSISLRKNPEQHTPTTVSTIPLIIAVGIAVWIIFFTSSSLPAPRACATVTPAPTESPIKRFTIKFMIAPVAPTAPTENSEP